MTNRYGEIIATYTLCNTATVNIYDIVYGIDDYVVAGINDNKPGEYIINYESGLVMNDNSDIETTPCFYINGLFIPLDECIRTNI